VVEWTLARISPGMEPMTLTHALWAGQIAAVADLPDERLERRLTAILVDTIEHPSASIPEAAGDEGQATATYRFYANGRVTAPALHRGLALATAQRCLDQDVLLVVQDTTTLNFTGLHAIPELGPIDSGGLARGVHLHTALAVTTSGQVIGILDQQYWARPQPGQPSPTAKESSKWIYGLEGAREALYTAAGDRPVPRLIHLMDREGDAYEVMMPGTVPSSGVLRTAGSTTRWPRRIGRCAAGRCCAGPPWRWTARRVSRSGWRGWNCGRCG
jgi:hypothetical protein